MAQLLSRLQYQHTLKILWSVMQIETYSDLRVFGAHCLSLMRWVNFRDAVAFKPSCLMPHPQPFAKLIWQRRLANVQSVDFWVWILQQLPVRGPAVGRKREYVQALVNPLQKKKSKTTIGHFNWFHQIYTLSDPGEKKISAPPLLPVISILKAGRRQKRPIYLSKVNKSITKIHLDPFVVEKV